MNKPKLVLALPKGRVLRATLSALREAGLEFELEGEARKLHHVAGEMHMLLLRNADVPTYVELGVAHAGVVGKDVLVESGRNVFEPVDLGLATCRLSLIRPRGAISPIRRVASKYPRITGNFLEQRGSAAEVVRLSGNVELACLTGLADAVVDVVDTGDTLKANNLEEIEVILRSSARLVVNRAALKLNVEVLRPLIMGLRKATAGSPAPETK